MTKLDKLIIVCTEAYNSAQKKMTKCKDKEILKYQRECKLFSDLTEQLERLKNIGFQGEN